MSKGWKKCEWKKWIVCEKEKDNSDNSCCISVGDNLKIINLNNNNFDIKILKIRLFSLIDIFSESSRFLENKNLIKKTSPPNYKNKIKNYSYSDLIKITKSTI
ncbi:MAG: hypothetical protein Q9M97_02665 [Candidatus Gracilibacteria bacterium]|nr:hypothetical protein [Candidatus Gracilibacteria bacterium]